MARRAALPRPRRRRHGGLASSEAFGFEVPRLTALHEVVALDTRGHGRSSISSERLTYALMASDVLAVMDELHLAHAAIVGESDGAIVGLLLAAQHPERVDALFAWGANFTTDAAPVAPPDPALKPLGPAYVARMQAAYRRLSPTPDGFPALLARRVPSGRRRVVGRLTRVPQGMSVSKGVIAGAAGTAALNFVTYGDIALRGRPPSELPSTVVSKLAKKAGISALAEPQAPPQKNRQSGLGALLGYFDGFGAGAAYGAIRPLVRGWLPWPVAGAILAAGTLVASEGGATALGATDWSTWSVTDWISDIVPRSVYGLVTAGVYEVLDER